MRIAICDDENEWINQIESYIDRIKPAYTKIEQDVFNSGEELLLHYERSGNVYDILILDIEMKGLSGIEVAEIIRERDPDVNIFFLTSHTDYVYECFRPMPMNFWRKPITYDEFESDIRRAYMRMENSEKYIKITENRERIRLKCKDIIFIENKDRKSWIYTASEIYKVNKLLSEFERQLDDKVFVRVYKSFIVNLAYIHKLKENEIELYNNNTIIPISRTYKADLINSYMSFKEKENF